MDYLSWTPREVWEWLKDIGLSSVLNKEDWKSINGARLLELSFASSSPLIRVVHEFPRITKVSRPISFAVSAAIRTLQMGKVYETSVTPIESRCYHRRPFVQDYQ